jgi:hypothetical protein
VGYLRLQVDQPAGELRGVQRLEPGHPDCARPLVQPQNFRSYDNRTALVLGGRRNKAGAGDRDAPPVPSVGSSRSVAPAVRAGQSRLPVMGTGGAWNWPLSW